MNIYDVARMAGVSISTASKAINDRKDVSPATRERVLEVARQIDYYPSHLARGLAQRRTENIGILAIRRFEMPLFTNPFYSRVIEGMEMLATEKNYNLLLSVVRAEEGEENPSMPKMVRERSVDGMLLMGYMPESFVREIVEKRLPVVVIDNYYEEVATEYVISDNRLGAKKAVKSLIELGHKNIALVSPSQKEYSYHERKQGYLEALKEAGLQAGLETIHEDPWVDWDTWLPTVLQGQDQPSAFFCCTDDHALHLMQAASRMGLSIPKDISVVGCDDISEAESADLTTVRVEKAAMGRRAVERLLEIIADPEQKRQTNHFPTRVLHRSSTAKAK